MIGKRWILGLGTLAGLVLLVRIARTQTQAEVVHGDAAAGEAKVAMCAGCHGMDGNSPNPSWPKLAGQVQTHFVKLMRDFKAGAWGSMMPGVVAGVSEEDFADMAAWYAQQPVRVEEADPKLMDLGREIYRWGKPDQGMVACGGCHGRDGSGYEIGIPGGIPSVRGQHAPYLVDQMQAYREGRRSSDWNGVMQKICARLSDEEIQAVAAYMSTLP